MDFHPYNEKLYVWPTGGTNIFETLTAKKELVISCSFLYGLFCLYANIFFNSKRLIINIGPTITALSYELPTNASRFLINLTILIIPFIYICYI